MGTEAKQIIEELRAIRADLEEIKREMPHKDMFLSAKEKNLLEQSYNKFSTGLERTAVSVTGGVV